MSSRQDKAPVSPQAIRLSELQARHATGIWEDLPPLVVVEPDPAAGAETGAEVDFLAQVPVITALPPELSGTQAALSRRVDLQPVEADWPAICRTMAATPHAARVLAQLLRATESLPIGHALTLESMAYGMLQAGSEYRRHHDTRPPLRARPARARSAPLVLVRQDETRIRLTLNRRERGNAINAALRAELCDAFAAAGAAGTAICLDGLGRHFCIGGDLSEFGADPDPLHSHDLRLRRDLPRLVALSAGRLTAHVQGKVIGAGVELSSFAARVVCEPGTTWRLPEVAMGLLPGSGGTVSVPRRIGRQRTLLMCLADKTLDVATALEWGLVDACAQGGVMPRL